MVRITRRQLFAAAALPLGGVDSLASAYQAIGFDPAASDAFTSVWMADVHYGIGKPENILPPVIQELTALSLRPAFIAIVGDLILTASLSFGVVPNAKQRETALDEFRSLKPHLDDLARIAPLKLTLGNHDTYPGEADAGLFHTVFPSHPVTHSFEAKGVGFVILNGGSCGMLGSGQQAWFREQGRKWRRNGTVVMAVHQPSAGRLVRERGIGAAMRDALPGMGGDLWLIGGHEHRNEDKRFRLPDGTTFTEATITAGNPATWGTDHPGYWIYCFQGGRLKGRLFRHVGGAGGFAVHAARAAVEARPLMLPFEGQEGVLWRVLVGEGDEPYRVTTQASWCLNYWTYVRRLEYRFPLSLAGGKARRCAVLLESAAGKDRPVRIAVSPDGQSWQEPAGVAVEGEYHTFAIPPSCLAAGVLTLKLENCAVSGFALVG